MSPKSISSRSLDHGSKRRSFIRKLLTRKPLTSSSTGASVASLDRSAATPLRVKHRPHSGSGQIVDSESFTGDDFSYSSGDESEQQDVMLSAGDTNSVTDDSELYEKRNEKVDFPMYRSSAPAHEELPWAGLTYEALVSPKYVRATRRSQKSPRALGNLFLAQELRCGSREGETSDVESESDPDVSMEAASSIAEEKLPTMNQREALVMEFSRDGKYLAVAGRDCRITVWKVISSPLAKLKYSQHEANRVNDGEKKKMKVYSSAPVFHQEPVRVFEGHTSTILSLDWSKNNFLISGSMDRTARLWNIERSGCLETFKHLDFVTTVQFHPNDDRFFLSGSLDNYVRLWSILESSVTYTRDLGDDVLVTTVSFTPYGNYCMVGGFNGSLFLLETKGLHVVERHDIAASSPQIPFRHKNKTKITGIKIFENESATEFSYDKIAKYNVLITTDDSKIRLIDLRLKKVVTKFKGNANSRSSFVASLSDDCRFIIAAAVDNWCYLWENNNSIINNKLHMAMKDMYLDGKNHLNEKHKKISKFLHDNKLWKKLNFFEDHNGDVYAANENTSYSGFHPYHSKVNLAVFAPDSTKKLLEFSDDIIFDLVKRGPRLAKAGIFPPRHKRHNFSPATGLDKGHIIITCDTTGLIRVFRQDSAYYVRKSLVEIRKNCLKNSSRDCSQTALNETIIDRSTIDSMIDPSLVSQRSLRSKSFSPLSDSSPFDNCPVKSRIQKQFKSPDLPTSASMAAHVPRLQSSQALRAIGGNDSRRLVSLASQVSFRNLDRAVHVERHDILAVNETSPRPSLRKSEFLVNDPDLVPAEHNTLKIQTL